ncbi:hypothetical protein APLC1_3735 [Limnospira platensis C1]|nr:hypothetical protein APLC1_3735 [Arthrospira platensis C1]
MSSSPSYRPPFFLKNGLIMTLYTALQISKTWQNHTHEPAPPYQQKIFTGAGVSPSLVFMQFPPTPKAQ